jgi:hypothetical protein
VNERPPARAAVDVKAEQMVNDLGLGARPPARRLTRQRLPGVRSQHKFYARPVPGSNWVWALLVLTLIGVGVGWAFDHTR